VSGKRLSDHPPSLRPIPRCAGYRAPEMRRCSASGFDANLTSMRSDSMPI
jgi:hypothetical protein